MEDCVTALTDLDKRWLTEAVRLREEHAGPLEDQEANRRARQHGGDLPTRIEQRALWLAERDGMRSALQHWKQGARLALALLLVLAVFSGAGLALAALGDSQRPINVFWALGSLLGLNLLLLLGWALGFFFAGEQVATLGRLWMWLSEKFARDAQAAHLAPALLVLLQRQKLNRWLLGLLVHGLWLVALATALVMLLILLATRRYGFVWETTILGANTFVGLTQALGALPSLLGFNVPDVDMIRASGDSQPALELARQAWASWLLGVLLLYGIVPRLALAALCLWRWRSGRERLQLDLKLPGYSQLREALMPSSERLGVNDAAPEALPQIVRSAGEAHSDGALLVGLELDDQRPWPPALPKSVSNAGILDSRESRNKLLEQLSRFPPARLAIACDPRRSPDRGSLALLAELARNASATRIWLLQALPGQALDADRLGDWHQALEQLGLEYADSAPLNWLEHGHD
ncbi:putative membrane protein [compost metagenome]